MHDTSGQNIIVALQKKWTLKALASRFFIALAITVFITVLLNKLCLLSFYWSVPFLIILFLLITIIGPAWQLSDRAVAAYLNSTQPELEESTHLLLRPKNALNFLEKIQAGKVETRLRSIKIVPPFKTLFSMSLITLSIGLTASLALFIIPFKTPVLNRQMQVKGTPSARTLPEKILPQIKNVLINIMPPAYTNTAPRQQSSFNVSAEDGAVVTWQIQTNALAKEVTLIFNDGKTLRSVPGENKTWKTQLLIKTPGFYQVKIDGNLSEFYKIETVKDQPPTIVVHSPKPNTFINYGMPEKVRLDATIMDDYGINTLTVSATISRGEGESVKFTEQNILFQKFSPGRKTVQLQNLLDCKILGMAPGDELYFYISTADTHKQQTRSDVYRITLQDTTELMSMEGMATSLDIKPELFRSQRQIIIETEQLLKDKSTIAVVEFRKKSNDLGIDQKLLRLRYGKFLGEETDTEIGNGDTEDEHRVQSNHPDNTVDIIKKYGHEHDNAEDATFFDASTKKQLKATLSEMWGAELKLRTYSPKEALPYEYKALQLLKDLQQKSRVYVQKTGIAVTPLKADKRLTGDLSKIIEPVTQENFEKPDSTKTIVGRALGALEFLKAKGRPDATSQNRLQQAFQLLSIKAASEPAAYLTSLSALKKILTKKYEAKDIDSAEKGLQKMTVVIERLPYNTSTNMNLSKQYFIKLHKSNKQ